MKKKTLVVFLLDMSGSMSTALNQTISGANEYIETLKKSEDTYISFIVWNSNEYTVLGNAVPIANAPMLTTDNYKPDAVTPLYDSIGRAVRETDQFLSEHPEFSTKKGQKVNLVIFTDGLENASREFTRSMIFNILQGKQQKGWGVVYLGANQDAYMEAGTLGISRGNTANYMVAETAKTFQRAAVATMNYVYSSTPISSLLEENDD